MAIRQLTIDFETRSPVNLKTRGAYVYAESPYTEPMCLSYAIGRNRPKLWIPDKFLEIINTRNLRYPIGSTQELFDCVKSADKIVAQNSMFEYLVWNWIMARRYGWVPLPLEKLHDTMAQLAYHALPLNLDQAGKALNLRVKKDTAGHRVMLKLCKPRKPSKSELTKYEKAGFILQDDHGLYDPITDILRYEYHEKPEDLETVFNYCGQDAETERLVHNSLADLPPREREIWLLSEKINLRGVPVDTDNIQSIITTVKQYEADKLAEFSILTQGAVTGPRSYVKLRDWVNNMTGIGVKSVDKESTELLLNRKDLPEVVRKVLAIKSSLGMSSVAKFTAMIDRQNSDGRVRGFGLYHGASTGRWAARGLQLHNNPRDSYKPDTWEKVIEYFLTQNIAEIELFYGDIFYTASRCIRGAIKSANGKDFLCTDFSSVEAIGNAFLAGEESALDIFRNGQDIYKAGAADILNKQYDAITKKERNSLGKISELSLGYGGGIGAFASMAVSYKVDLEELPAIILPNATGDELVSATKTSAIYLETRHGIMSRDAAIACDIIKQKWRKKRPHIVAFWNELENAAFSAIMSPGQVFSYRSIRYVVRNGFLKCQLPSGRVIHYYSPRIAPVESDYGTQDSICYMGLRQVDEATTKQWTVVNTYGGKLVENVVQGFCRDLLCEGMLNHEKSGYPIIMHVHDEDLSEVDRGTGDLDGYNKIMCILPNWAKGMPLSANGWRGTRYCK